MRTRDLSRYRFIAALASAAGRSQIQLSSIEWDFVLRLTADYENNGRPEIHDGDRNIADSLKRKYGQMITPL